MMKKRFCLGMLVIVAFAFGMIVIGCDNGSTPKNDDIIIPSETLKAVGPGGWTYVLDIGSESRNIRSVQEGNNYTLTVRTPKKGNGNSFDGVTEEEFIVKIETITPIGTNKKLLLIPYTYEGKEKFGNSFEITLDKNGTMHQINSLKGGQKGALVPISNNSEGIEGAWFMWFVETDDNPEKDDELLSNAIIIGEDSMTITINNYKDMEGKEIDHTQYQRCNYTFSGSIMSLSNWEEYKDDQWVEWVSDDPGQTQPSEITIEQLSSNSIRIPEIADDFEYEEQGILKRIITE